MLIYERSAVEHPFEIYTVAATPHPIPVRLTQHPAIIWIHGSGADQNYLAWHPGAYRMYYAICQYLAQQGCVILTPDYRGSSGYSRAWATGA